MQNLASFETAREIVDFVNGESLEIVAVDAGADQITLRGNLTQRIKAGSSFDISGSTGNDGTYTVDTVTTGAGTVITTVEDITDSTADGYVTPAPLAQAKVDMIRQYDGRWWLTWWD